MNVLFISGSPRPNSNADILLQITMEITGGKFIKLSHFDINPCLACWKCLQEDVCVLNDDITSEITPMLLESDGIVLGSPVFFNNVSSQMKAFMDRTWCLRGKLLNKLGGAIVVGRGYGTEGAITAINAFFLKHEMIPVNRGVSGLAFESGEIIKNKQSIRSAELLGERLLETAQLFHQSSFTG